MEINNDAFLSFLTLIIGLYNANGYCKKNHLGG